MLDKAFSKQEFRGGRAGGVRGFWFSHSGRQVSVTVRGSQERLPAGEWHLEGVSRGEEWQ
jgi:hypothetical protein